MIRRMTLTALLVAAFFVLNACSSPPPPRPKPVVKPFEQVADVSQADTALKGTKFEDGYVYEQRNRRDPFMTLIIPSTIKQKAEADKVGTLEGYDLSEFVLAAIAKRGTEYYALLTTPDKRSFTVTKGNVIGLNQGRVEEITEDSIVFVEYSRDYKGDIKPKLIILEFVKGESR